MQVTRWRSSHGNSSTLSYSGRLASLRCARLISRPSKPGDDTSLRRALARCAENPPPAIDPPPCPCVPHRLVIPVTCRPAPEACGTIPRMKILLVFRVRYQFWKDRSRPCLFRVWCKSLIKKRKAVQAGRAIGSDSRAAIPYEPGASQDLAMRGVSIERRVSRDSVARTLACQESAVSPASVSGFPISRCASRWHVLVESDFRALSSRNAGLTPA
jgi:hypothetical protein